MGRREEVGGGLVRSFWGFRRTVRLVRFRFLFVYVFVVGVFNCLRARGQILLYHNKIGVHSCIKKFKICFSHQIKISLNWF